MKHFAEYKKEQMAPARFYYHFSRANKKGERITVEICRCSGTGRESDLPHLWLKQGKTKSLVENYICAETYVTLQDGRCVMKYNPTIRREVVRNIKGEIELDHFVLDFAWLLESNGENEARIIDEVARRFYGGKK